MNDLNGVKLKFEAISAQLQESNLTPSKVGYGILKGGLSASDGYATDYYITYKTKFGDAVALTVLRESKESPLFLQLWRRRRHDRLMTTISVDVIPIDEIDVAGNLFIAICKLISSVPNSWRSQAAGAVEK